MASKNVLTLHSSWSYFNCCLIPLIPCCREGDEGNVQLPGDGLRIFRNVGSISNLGGTSLRGHFFLKKKGAFLRMKRPLLFLLQNLGGHVPPVPPRFLRLCVYFGDVPSGRVSIFQILV